MKDITTPNTNPNPYSHCGETGKRYIVLTQTLTIKFCELYVQEVYTYEKPCCLCPAILWCTFTPSFLRKFFPVYFTC